MQDVKTVGLFESALQVSACFVQQSEGNDSCLCLEMSRDMRADTLDNESFRGFGNPSIPKSNGNSPHGRLTRGRGRVRSHPSMMRNL